MMGAFTAEVEDVGKGLGSPIESHQKTLMITLILIYRFLLHGHLGEKKMRAHRTVDGELITHSFYIYYSAAVSPPYFVSLHCHTRSLIPG